MNLISKQATTIHNANSIQQQSVTSGTLQSTVERILGIQQITGVRNDLRLLLINQNRLQIDSNQKHKLYRVI